MSVIQDIDLPTVPVGTPIGPTFLFGGRQLSYFNRIERMPHELINRFEMDPVIGRFYRSARLTAEIVQRSHQVLAQSRQLLRNNLDGATARDREMQREAELQRLAVADRQIADAERAVTKQTVELEKLRRDGLDTHLAEHTLQHFEALLQAMHKHREEIVRTIAHIDQGLV